MPDNANTAEAIATTHDIRVAGNPDVWDLVCKASSHAATSDMTKPKPSPDFWGFEGDERLSCTDRDDAIEARLDDCYPGSWPETLEVLGFAHDERDSALCHYNARGRGWSPLEGLLESLDEVLADPDGSPTEPTPAMLEAERAFVQAVFPAQRYTRLAQLLAASPTPTPTQER